MRCRLVAPAHPNQPEQWAYPECVNCGCDWKYRCEMKRLDDGSWQCADEDDCQDNQMDQEFFRLKDIERGDQPPEVVQLDPDDPVIVAFTAAMNALGRDTALRKPGLHYLAWAGWPYRDWAELPSLTCRKRSSRHWRCESDRPRRLRACLRAHPSDGPPAAVAGIGSVLVIDP